MILLNFIAVFSLWLHLFCEPLWAVDSGSPSQTSSQLRIVGSTALYGFAASVAERFGRLSPHKTPLIEANGTGGGFKIFCQSGPHKGPDAVNASRSIEEGERKFCEKKDVFNLVEFKVGHDGIVLATHHKTPQIDLTLRDLFKALARVVHVEGQWVQNPYKRWSDINQRFPNEKISILGPPPSSGTYSVLVDLILRPLCPKGHPRCLYIRTDGAYIQASEHENVIAQKVILNPKKFGVFSFSFLKNHKDKLNAMRVEGTQPTFQTIMDKTYPLSRSLYIYTTEKRLREKPLLKDFIQSFYDEKAMSSRGYLILKGLIPLTKQERLQVQNLFDRGD